MFAPNWPRSRPRSIVASGLQQQHRAASVGAEAICQDTSSRTCPHDNVVGRQVLRFGFRHNPFDALHRCFMIRLRERPFFSKNGFLGSCSAVALDMAFRGRHTGPRYLSLTEGRRELGRTRRGPPITRSHAQAPARSIQRRQFSCRHTPRPTQCQFPVSLENTVLDLEKGIWDRIPDAGKNLRSERVE